MARAAEPKMRATRDRGPTLDELRRILEPHAVACRQLVNLYVALTELAGNPRGSAIHNDAAVIWSTAFSMLSCSARELQGCNPSHVQIRFGIAMVRLLSSIVGRSPAALLEHASEIRELHESMLKIARRLSWLIPPAKTVVDAWGDLRRSWAAGRVADLDRRGTLAYALARAFASA